MSTTHGNETSTAALSRQPTAKKPTNVALPLALFAASALGTILGVVVSFSILKAVTTDPPDEDPPEEPPAADYPFEARTFRAFDSCVETPRATYCIPSEMPMFRQPIEHTPGVVGP